MNTSPSRQSRNAPSLRQGAPRRVSRTDRGFTLTEVMVTLALFTLLMAGLMASQLMGLRMRKVTETKLSATAGARKALNDIRDEVRMARQVSIGEGDESTFKPACEQTPQTGNALQILSTTDTNAFIRYYLDPGQQALMRVTGKDRTPVRIALDITNAMAFSAEDFSGRVLTNSQNNRVIRMLFEFRQWQYPVAQAAGGGMHDYYRLQTRVTRRAID